ncbi:MAG: hypothetical protein ACE5I2_06230 [Anaerolineae bacterium]
MRKVAFSSDWPGIPHIKRNIEIVRGLPLKEERNAYEHQKSGMVGCGLMGAGIAQVAAQVYE